MQFVNPSQIIAQFNYLSEHPRPQLNPGYTKR